MPGVEQAAGTGLAFSAVFAMTGRLWMLLCAHSAFDLTALAIIYWSLESDVAQRVFKQIVAAWESRLLRLWGSWTMPTRASIRGRAPTTTPPTA